jgi:hypothetical protein
MNHLFKARVPDSIPMFYRCDGSNIVSSMYCSYMNLLEGRLDPPILVLKSKLFDDTHEIPRNIIHKVAILHGFIRVV